MNQPLKYEFASFTGAARGVEIDEARREISDDELDEIRREAFADGEAKGRADAEASIERRRVEAIEAVGASVRKVAGHFMQTHAELEKGSSALSFAIGRAIGGVATARAPLDVIRPLIVEALDALTDDTRVVVEVHEAIVDIAQTEIEAVAEEIGFAGRIRVRAGADNVADCRIDWGEGGIERRVADITAEIAERLAAHGIALPPARAAAGEK